MSDYEIKIKSKIRELPVVYTSTNPRIYALTLTYTGSYEMCEYVLCFLTATDHKFKVYLEKD